LEARVVDGRNMTETIIVRDAGGFRTFSGWVINRTAEALVLAAVADATGEPVATLIPIDSIVSQIPIAA
jgi:hypothetical protein